MKRLVIFLAVLLVLGGAIWITPFPLVRYCLAFALLWLLPGLAWASLILPAGVLDRAEWLAVGLGLSLVITPVVVVLVSYLPGSLTASLLLVAIAAAVVLPLALSVLLPIKRRSTAGLVDEPAGERPSLPSSTRPKVSVLSARHPLWKDGWGWLLVALLVAGGIRVINLNYAEFQGDEASVLLRAAQVLEGDKAAIFQHKKGPAELAVVMAPWRLAGVTNEWMARLPFAWASILGLVAVFLCGRRLDRPHAGGIAACLLAIEGYLVGFGRIVQYQSLVVALGALAFLCCLVYYACGRGSLVTVGAALIAGGFLAHYDAVWVLPPAIVLIGARLWLERDRLWRALRPVFLAAVVGVALLAVFYLPFSRSPYLGNTASYVSGRVGDTLHNNLRSIFELSAVYDSIYFLILMALAIAAQTMITWRKWGRAGPWLSGLLLITATTTLVRPEWWTIDGLTLAMAPAAILLTGALLAPGQLIETRAVWLWMTLPALFYGFVAALPLTHVYTALPAWALLAGMGLAHLGRWLMVRSRPAFWAAAAAALAIFAISGFYTSMMFVDHSPEYRRTFPQSKQPLYWTPYEQIPKAGLFGFPYRAGWDVVKHLMEKGELTGTYDSNEESEITDLYTRRATRLQCASPDTYIVAVNVQDELPMRQDQIEEEYQPGYVVTVGGQPKMTIYRRHAAGPPLVLSAEEVGRHSDHDWAPQQVARPQPTEIGSRRPEGHVPREALVGDFAHLLGFTVDTRHALPGGYVELTVFWQALSSAPLDFHIFTHLYDGEMRGQADGQPGCGNYPTSQWLPGQVITDPYRIPIREDAPPGPVPLTVGMYDWATLQRLPIRELDGTPSGDHVFLTDVVIQTP